MNTPWNDALVEQLDWYWTNHARPRLDGLADDEYRWEPVAGCWSLRPRSDALAEPVGVGATSIDFVVPEPEPEPGPEPGPGLDQAPVTTIAWRMAHIAIGIFGTRAADHFGEPGSVEYENTDYSLTAVGGLELLDRHYAAWTAGVRALGDDGLATPCGPAEGPFADNPLLDLVLHINREAIHHMAEIALLRDLYAHRETLGAGS